MLRVVFAGIFAYFSFFDLSAYHPILNVDTNWGECQALSRHMARSRESVPPETEEEQRGEVCISGRRLAASETWMGQRDFFDADEEEESSSVCLDTSESVRALLPQEAWPPSRGALNVSQSSGIAQGKIFGFPCLLEPGVCADAFFRSVQEETASLFPF